MEDTRSDKVLKYKKGEPMNSELFERYFVGDDCVCWSFGDKIDIEVNKKALYLYRRFRNSPLFSDLPLYDVVPSYKAIAVFYDPATKNVQEMIEKIEAFLGGCLSSYTTDSEHDIKKVVIPIVYDGEDLSQVAELHNITIKEVIKKHTAPVYQVAMVGFKPYFPYLVGLDEGLTTPRLDNPRTSIPAGAVGIGGAQTGIYPEESPGGWNLIGRTNPELLKQIKPGDIVLMREVKDL